VFCVIPQAFDKKTSVMHFLIRLVQAQDPDVLNFRQDLAHIQDASVFSTGAIIGELGALAQQLDVAKAIPMLGTNEEPASSVAAAATEAAAGEDLSSAPYSLFLQVASGQLESAHAEVNRVQRKYRDILNYFGEDPDLSSEVFFQTLNKFGASFDQAVFEVTRTA
jgi:hypothetical protein